MVGLVSVALMHQINVLSTLLSYSYSKINMEEEILSFSIAYDGQEGIFKTHSATTPLRPTDKKEYAGEKSILTLVVIAFTVPNDSTQGKNTVTRSRTLERI
jgi:hypothetical protein